MKKLKYTIAIIVFPMLVFSQQMPHYSLYMINDVVVNPSVISSKTDNQISLMVRDQWTGFEGTPKTQSISYYNVEHEKFGRGIRIVNDNTGPISMLSGTISGSYLVPIENKNNLSVGASANILQYKIENSDIILEDDGVIDPAMNGGVTDKVIGNSASIGVNYFSRKFNVGASIINVINSDLNLSNTGVENALVNHYYLNAAYNFSTSEGLIITPSIMFKKIGASIMQMDLNLKTSINNTIWGGLSYRTNDAVIAMLGLILSDYTFGYSYDITTTKMNIPSYGSHGIVMTYKLKAREKDSDKDGVLDKDDGCPKIPGVPELNGCPDRDKDGIQDWEDECPDFPGLAINNGCPDKDSDGIIDKYDRCPDVPGVPELNGCPDSDGDGLQDELDNCPYVKGSLRNMGCPDTLKIIEQDTIKVFVKIPSFIDTITEVTWENIPLWADRVHFEFNEHYLDENSKIILNKVAEFLKTNPNSNKNIQINGHADERGTEKYNIKLSKRRAESVYKYLVKQGVSKKRLSTKAFGESQKTSSSHEENRRVEFKVVE